MEMRMPPDGQNQKTHERRFELPVQNEAKARLDAFRRGVKDYQQKSPEVLGATVFGSMIKGKQARSESDVDAYLYIDAEDPRYNQKPSQEYKTEFLESTGVTDKEDQEKYYHDMRPQILSSVVIGKEIEDRLEYYMEKEQFKKTRDQALDRLLLVAGKEGRTLTTEERKSLDENSPKFRTIDSGVAGMFHARVGSGLEKYRELFLEKIMSLPDRKVAEKLWAEVAADLKTFEKRSDRNVAIELPDTLDKALMTYHPKLSSALQKIKDNKRIEELQQKLLFS